MKEYILKKIEKECDGDTKIKNNTESLIRCYLDLIIDDYSGILPYDQYEIAFQEIVQLLNIGSNKEDIIKTLLDGNNKFFKMDEDYIVRPYSNLGVKKRLEGHQGDKRYNHIFFTP